MSTVARRRVLAPASAACIGILLTFSSIVAGPVRSAGSAVPAASPISGTAKPTVLGAFLGALRAVETGGRYDARNPVSGAYGAYQIVPSNWPAWASRYLGNRNARPTRANQDRVAAGRVTDLYRSLGRWDRVAYWWLTGSSRPASSWSPSARRYVARVMSAFRARLAVKAPRPGTVLDDRNPAIVYAGAWREAAHPAYLGGHARYARTAGATATLAFTGRSIRIVGPTGPTRGRMAVIVDGRAAGTVDLRAARFRPSRVVFARAWSASAAHTVQLRVLGTRGRPIVAVDRFIVGG